ncbi:MAG: hypothetical protein U5K84_01275 [Alkalibacterium sp.]|nr:hypothetical protein [Alkalibacterium sp.]
MNDIFRDIEELVSNNTLFEEREYYGSSWLRGAGKHVCQLVNNGTRYVEFRSFDVNPFEPLWFPSYAAVTLSAPVLVNDGVDGRRRYRMQTSKRE